MFNFFHNLGVGIMSTVLAITGIFHQAPTVATSTQALQTATSSIAETLPTSSVVAPVAKQEIGKTSKVDNSAQIQAQVQAEAQAQLKIKEKADADAQAVIKAKADQEAMLVKQGEEQAKASAQKASNPIKEIDKGTPYQGQNGNWYYPNAFNDDGSALEAPKPRSATMSTNSNNSTDINAPLVNGQYSSVPIMSLGIIGQNDTFHLHSVKVHFIVVGTAQVTTAYLYQGETVPVASAVVSNNIATFNIPNNTQGASFGSNIPTQFTIKADINGVAMPQPYNQYSSCDVRDRSSHSISVKINDEDVGLFDSRNSVVKIGEVVLGNEIKWSTSNCIPKPGLNSGSYSA